MNRTKVLLFSVVALLLLGLLLSSKPAAGATVLQVTYSAGRPYTSYGDTYYKIVGLVQNVGTGNVSYWAVSASLYDASGRLIAIGNDTNWPVLMPSETSPFVMLVSYPTPSDIARYSLQVTGSESSYAQPYRSLASLSQHVFSEYSWSSSQTLVGEILNAGTQYTVIPSLGGILIGEYDGSGNLIDVEEYASNYISPLIPGQRTPFTVSVGSDLPIASFRVLLYARLSETYPVPLSVAVTNTYVSSSTRHIVGTVRNSSSVTAKYAYVIATLRDASGKAVHATERSTSPVDVLPGQEVSFDLTVSTSIPFTSYDLQTDSSGTAAPVPFPAPLVTGPAHGSTLGGLGGLLTWINPTGSTQFHLQVLPANNDGPGINLIRNVEASYTVQPPVMGQGNYVMLPGMTYSWRVRATSKATFAPENDPSWGSWSPTWTFRTPPPNSATISPVSPANGATVASTAPLAIQWQDASPNIFYYEVQASPDLNFGAQGAVASVWHNLVHGGVTNPLNSWLTPQLQSGTIYYWRVRPRVQGDGTAVAWSTTWSFRTP